MKESQAMVKHLKVQQEVTINEAFQESNFQWPTSIVDRFWVDLHSE